MEWSKEVLLHVIALISERPSIWNNQSSDYNKKNRKEDAKEVAIIMGTTIKEIYRIWNYLRVQYRTEKKRMFEAASCSNSKCGSTWFAYGAMQPLMENNLLTLSDIRNKELDETLPLSSSPTPQPADVSSAQLRRTSTPTEESAPIVKAKQAKKRENESNKSSIQNTTNPKLRKKEKDIEDDLTSYGLYIVAHLRKFSPYYQSKAKHEIIDTLYRYDMKILNETSTTFS